MVQNNNRNNNIPTTDVNTVDMILSRLMSRSARPFNLVITIGIPPIDPSVEIPRNHMPIYITARNTPRRTPSGEREFSPVSFQFFGYVEGMMDAIKKKGKIRKELMRNKPYMFTKDMEPKECTICLDEFKAKQSIRKLDCEHEFHKKCIDKWLLGGDSCCPLCRKEPFCEKKLNEGEQ